MRVSERASGLLLIAAAIVLAVLLPLADLLYAPLSLDEHVSFWIAEPHQQAAPADRSSGSAARLVRTGQPGLWRRSLHYSATPPLSFLVQRACLELFGVSEWSLRLLAYVAFVAAVLLVGVSGAQWFGPIAGGLAACLMAVAPQSVRYAALGRPYSVGVCLAATALLATEPPGG